MENDNTMSVGDSVNEVIVHATPHTDGTEGTTPPQLDDGNNNNIREVDMPENQPAEIIDVDADDTADGQQEDPTGDNPGENTYQNQDGVYNTTDVIAATAAEDMTKYRAAGDNPEGSIEVEDADDEDDDNGSDDYADNVMGVDVRYPRSKSNHK